nr:AraC family transcriptional regulator [Jiangella mangrovi]
MEIVADGRRTECAPGVLVLGCAGQVLEERLVERGSVATVRVDRDDLRLSDRTLEAAVTGNAGREGWQANFVTAAGHTIAGLWEDGSQPDPAGIDGYAAGVIELLIRSIAGARTDAVPVDPNRRRQIAEEFIERHLLDPTLSVQSVASFLRISPRQLARDLDGGPSVTVMILRARLRHADRLLRSPAHSELMLAQIAQICHFSSQARFSHAYKEHYGVTPREVRAAAQAHRRAQR